MATIPTVNEVRAIVEKALARSGYSLALSDEQLTPIHAGDADNILYGLGGRERSDSFVYDLFNTAAPNRRAEGTKLYHFKTLTFLQSILETCSIQASNLESNSQNDHSEFEEFIRRYSNLFPLVPDNYDRKKNSVIPPSGRPVDQYRKDTCILCFTQSYDNPRFWEEYVSNSSGVALEFNFLKFKDEIFKGQLKDGTDYESSVKSLFELRDVCYDSTGYLFDFINEITYYLYKNFGLLFFVPGMYKMAAWYKRARYIWEKETRLVFDLQFIGILNKKRDEFFEVGEGTSVPGERTYVVVPFSNRKHATKSSRLFDIELSRIIVGENVSDKEFVKYSKLAHKYFDRIEVVRYADLKSKTGVK